MKRQRNCENDMGEIIEKLENGEPTNIQCLVGFDGYIDEIYQVVKSRETDDQFKRYKLIKDFGERILLAAGKSADIEIVLKEMRFGGNAPIMANALSTLSFNTTCIGQMDSDEGTNPFEHMNSECIKISTGNCSKTMALEFCDGKIMLGNLSGKSLNWETIKQKVGLDQLTKHIKNSSLISIVNWSGLDHMNEIVNGLKTDIFDHLTEAFLKNKYLFFDLSDPSARSKEKLEVILKQIKELGKKFKVILGLNENEAYKLGLILESEANSIEEIGKDILKLLEINYVCVHTNYNIFGFSEDTMLIYEGMHVLNPVISTGAGDNFNAGLCMGFLEDCSFYQSMILGQATASFYISKGKSPKRKELSNYIKEYYCI